MKIHVLPYKEILANVGSLGSWTRLRVSEARPHGRSREERAAEAVPGGPQAIVLFPAFLCPAPVCYRVTLHTARRHDGLVCA